MNTTILSVVFIQVILFIIFLIIYTSLFEDVKKSHIKNKVFFGIISGLIGSTMLFIDSFNEYNLFYMIYTSSIRLFLIAFLTIYSGRVSLLTAILLMMITKLIFMDISFDVKILQIMYGFGIWILSNLILFLKFKNKTKWGIVISFVMICSIYFINQREIQLIYTINYLLFSLALTLFTYFILMLLDIFNREFDKYYNSSKFDYVSRVFNLQYLRQVYVDAISNKIPFKMVFLTFENYKVFKSSNKLSECYEVLSNIGKIITLHIGVDGIVGKTRNDQFCIIFLSKLNESDQLLYNITHDIEAYYSKHSVTIKPLIQMDKTNEEDSINTKIFTSQSELINTITLRYER